MSDEHLKYRAKTLAGHGWPVLPLPELRADLDFVASYSLEEFELIWRGVAPREMEDKWFIYYDPQWVYFHRSWTGACLFGLKFEVSENKATVVESWASRDTKYYKETDIDYDRRLIAFLIDELLLHKPAIFPVHAYDPPGIDRLALQHSIVGRVFPGQLQNGAPKQAVTNDRQDRCRGVMLGMAVGDALGMPLEFLTKPAIVARYGGMVTGYVKASAGHPCERLSPGQYTDDTQMALALAKSILDKGDFSPHAFKRRLVEWYECKDHRAPGNACIQAVQRLDEGVSYKESGIDQAAGCGSAMRVPPLALVYKGGKLSQHSFTQSLMTHRDERASIGTILTAQIVSKLLWQEGDSFERDAFLKEITTLADGLEVKLYHQKREFTGLLARFPELLEMPFDEGIQVIGTSGYVVHTVLAAFYGFLHTPHDFETTIVNLVNEGDDADSVAAIAGAFSGAFNGMGAIPARWLDPLEGREEIIDIADRLLQLKSASHNEPRQQLTLTGTGYHKIVIDRAFETGIGLDFVCVGLIKEINLLEVSNGHTRINVTACFAKQFNTWNVQGDISFDSPLLPSDFAENTEVINAAISDILRVAAGLTINRRQLDLSRFFKLIGTLITRTDEYSPPEEGQIDPATTLLKQEVAFYTLLMGHLYDAANSLMFGLHEPIVPMLKEKFQLDLPRDEALHRIFFNEAQTREVNKGMQRAGFLSQTADELLIKPKEDRMIN